MSPLKFDTLNGSPAVRGEIPLPDKSYTELESIVMKVLFSVVASVTLSDRRLKSSSPMLIMIKESIVIE